MWSSSFGEHCIIATCAARGTPQGHNCHRLRRGSVGRKRMCAAARELLKVHRQTLDGLRELDGRMTGQWVGANMGQTASAGLGIASAVLLFTVPPLGAAFGVG
mmetsp:Transcript_17690/g.57417  ORF Transcript_17690/g.57417 Transcript_17690/m.57417 type:complete len:103 (-) Transcript_17690:1165-1473(-)